uniref:UMP-CMP kinase n=1 Tax=Phallusia mammillata TaxID=59560 RepID=A0A6F9D9F0_9ASCI|nr:UMP-CMP kinase-like [Phallusia mammillata]
MIFLVNLFFRQIKHLSHKMSKPEVVMVLGGPGSGKGTQCSKIVEKFGYTHLSAGDLLRAERNNPESTVGQLIANYIKDGKIVPVEITCGLLDKAIFASGSDKILVDGFPRNQENVDGWNKQMGDRVSLKFVLFFSCPEEVCTARIMERGKTSGRTDDNIKSLQKRFITYINETMPIVRYYEDLGKVRKVDADRIPEEVFCDVEKLFS